MIGLGDGGAAVAAAVSTVNLALRTPAEQDALTAAYGRWLNSLTGPVQILIRAGHADLSAAVADLEDTAPALPDPDLEAAALDHAAFLADLASRRDPLRRQVLIVLTARGPASNRPRRPPAPRADDTARAANRPSRGVAARRVLDGPAVTARSGIRRRPLRPPRPGGPGRARRRHQPPPPLPPRRRGRRHDQEQEGPDTERRGAVAGAASLASAVAPATVEVTPRWLRVGDGYAATLVVTGYPPRSGAAGWSRCSPGRAAWTSRCTSSRSRRAAVSRRLRHQRARLESAPRVADRGQLADQDSTPPPEDAGDLARLARG